MDFLDDFSLELELDDAAGSRTAAPESSADVLAAAKRFSSGRSAAQLAYGNGKTRVGTGPMMLDWGGCVERMMATPSADERTEHARALGTLAQVASHGDAMREAGVVAAVTELLRDADETVAIAAAEAIRHLACANQGNRIAAREGGAIPLLVAMLQRVAKRCQAACEREAELSSHDAAVVTAATAALRNLSFQNGPNQDLIRFSGGLAPLLQIVAQGAPPQPPPAGTQRREAAYRAAGALENLAADNDDNATLIVEARVVPAMRELLIGKGGTAAGLSQKAARKGRQALLRLITLDAAAAKARAAAAANAAEAREAREAAAAVRAKVAALLELPAAADARKGAATGAGAPAVAEATAEAAEGLAARAAWAAAESELAGLAQNAGWACRVVRYARAAGQGASSEEGWEGAPPPLPCDDKVRRAAVYRLVKRSRLGEALAITAVELGGGAAAGGDDVDESGRLAFSVSRRAPE